MGTSIFGSCVSRDVFEFDDRLALDAYVARQSVVSSVSPAAPIEEDEIALSSAFQKRSVYSDIAKTAFDELARFDDSGWLLIDYFEERHPLAHFRETIITKSPEFNSSGLTPTSPVSYEVAEGQSNMVDGCSIEYWLDRFFSQIEGLFPPSRIIINRAYLTDSYWGGMAA